MPSSDSIEKPFRAVATLRPPNLNPKTQNMMTMENKKPKDSPVKPDFNVADRRFWNEESQDKSILKHPDEKIAYPTFVEDLLKKIDAQEQRLLEISKREKAMREEQVESKKRLERNQEKELANFKLKFFKSFIEIVDNLDRSVAYAQDKNSQFSDFLNGVVLLQTQFKELLKEHQVFPMEAKNKKFDPNWGEAIDVIPSEQEKDDNTILSVHQEGYFLQNLVVRPTRVSVGKYIASGKKTKESAKEQNPKSLNAPPK